MRLYVNIDHVATVRQARGTDEPDPVRAAVLAELAGADGITVHLREDRRHIQDRDVELLRQTLRTVMNLEVAVEPGVLAIAERLTPGQATLVPERREEITTEGGLSLEPERHSSISEAIARLREAGVRSSIFVDPDPADAGLWARLRPDAVELHTGEYANAKGEGGRARQLARLAEAAHAARAEGLAVHAGHGLTYENVMPVAAIEEIEELNIGHSIVSRAVLVGMERAVREMGALIRRARSGEVDPPGFAATHPGG